MCYLIGAGNVTMVYLPGNTSEYTIGLLKPSTKYRVTLRAQSRDYNSPLATLIARTRDAGEK